MKKLQALAVSVLAAASVAAARPPAVPLPKPKKADHTAEEIRGSLVHQIKAHYRYVAFMRAKWRRAAAVVPNPTPSYMPSGDWASELLAVGFPSSTISKMQYFIGRESGGCPTAVNGLVGCPSYSAAVAALADGSACGLMQLYPCPGPEALDPMTNLTIAYEKFQADGYGPWS